MERLVDKGLVEKNIKYLSHYLLVPILPNYVSVSFSQLVHFILDLSLNILVNR